MKRQISILMHLFIMLALSACGAARQPSRLPGPDEVKTYLVQLVDEQK
jgi:predicted small lipoprotein YifL